jgi:hypothetical protein
MSISKEQILERERRWARPVGIAALLGVALILGSLFVAGQAFSGDSDAEALRDINEDSVPLLIAYLMRGLGYLLWAPALIYLLQAAYARDQRVRRGLGPAIIVGALFLFAFSILTYISVDQAAGDFVADVESGATDDQQEDLADEKFEDNGLRDIAAGVNFGGAIGLGFGALYTSLWAMRAGLLTRFWGTLGMATGAVFLLIPFGLSIWIIYVGILIGRLAPGDRPPAWDAGEAIPWPGGGGVLGGGAQPEQEDVLEGSGRELSEPALPESGHADDDDGSPVEGETQGQRRRKRKRRG